METIAMSFENSKTSDLYRILLNLLDKINFKRIDKYVALSKYSILLQMEKYKKFIQK